MSRNNLSDIVRVAIDIEEPVSNTTSFNHMLILGPQPQYVKYEQADPVRACYEITSLSQLEGRIRKIVGVDNDFDLKKLGEVPVLDAARVAFAQNPSPAKIYVAFNKLEEPSIERCSVHIANNTEGNKNKLATLIGASNVTAEMVSNGDKAPGDEGYTFPALLVVRYAKRNVGESDASCSVTLGGNVIDAPNVFDVEYAESEDVVYDCYVYKLADYNDLEVNVSVIRTIEGATEYDRAVRTSFTSKFELKSKSTSSATTSSMEFKTDQVESFKITDVDGDEARESVEATVNNALSQNGWYVVCPTYYDPDILRDLADQISGFNDTPKMMAFSVFGDVKKDESTHDLVKKESFCTFGIYAGTYYGQTAEELRKSSEKNNLYLHTAWAAECLNNVAGSESWALKKLINVYGCDLDATDMQDLKDYNVSYYTKYADRNVTQGGKVGSGEWIDVVRFRDWLENDMQIRVFNTLVKHPKIPYTDEGISLIKNQMIASLRRGQEQGGIAPTEFDSDDNEIPGFVVNVPLAANISDIDKKSRILKDCTFRARLAGAIHVVEIQGTLAYTIKEE